MREWQGDLYEVTVLDEGFAWEGQILESYADRNSHNGHSLVRPPILWLKGQTE